MRHILDLTRPLTVNLKKKAMDLLKVKEEIVLFKSALTDMQTDIDTSHHALYEEAVTLARQELDSLATERQISRQTKFFIESKTV